MKYDINSINKRKKNVEILKKILGVILIIFIYNIILTIISLDEQSNGISIFGYRAYIITSNSMEPSIQIDDVIIVKKCKENKLEIGDVITFKEGQEVITHRIVEIEKNESGNFYITKGDNNNVEDSNKVQFSEILGKKVLTLHGLGKIITIISDKIIILLFIFIILIIILFNIQKQEKREIRREKKKVEEENWKI